MGKKREEAHVRGEGLGNNWGWSRKRRQRADNCIRRARKFGVLGRQNVNGHDEQGGHFTRHNRLRKVSGEARNRGMTMWHEMGDSLHITPAEIEKQKVQTRYKEKTSR